MFNTLFIFSVQYYTSSSFHFSALPPAMGEVPRQSSFLMSSLNKITTTSWCLPPSPPSPLTKILSLAQ